MADEQSINERLIKVEQAVLHLGSSYEKDMSEIKKALKEMSTPKATDWPKLISCAVGVVLLLCAFGQMWFSYRLNPVQNDVAALQRMNKDFDDLKKELHREMQWHFETADTRFNHVHDVLGKVFWKSFGSGMPEPPPVAGGKRP